VLLLLASVAFNYLIGLLLIAGRAAPRPRFAVLAFGSPADLLVLGTLNMRASLRQSQCAVFHRPHARHSVPSGFSFYTFTQIAFLVDAYRGNVARYALPHSAVRHLFPASDRGRSFITRT